MWPSVWLDALNLEQTFGLSPLQGNQLFKEQQIDQ